MNANGTHQVRLTDNVTEDAQPAWSPDGSKIAFTTFRDGNAEIYAMNAEGMERTRSASRTTWPGIKRPRGRPTAPRSRSTATVTATARSTR